MLKRIITAFAALIVFFAAIALKPAAFAIVVSAVILIMLFECFNAMKATTAVQCVGYASSVLLLAGLYRGQCLEAVILSIAAFMILMIAKHGKENSKDILTPGMLVFYVTIFMSYILKVRVEYGVYGMLWIFVCAWMSDTGAYFAGTFFGKHKLIPRVSPKKTVEGSVGGIIVCVLSCMLYLFIVSKIVTEVHGVGYIAAAIMGAVASIMSQFGDLAASAIKRDCNVKDYGNIFPGHGGFMDRFDSVMFIAPFVYYFMTLIK